MLNARGPQSQQDVRFALARCHDSPDHVSAFSFQVSAFRFLFLFLPACGGGAGRLGWRRRGGAYEHIANRISGAVRAGVDPDEGPALPALRPRPLVRHRLYGVAGGADGGRRRGGQLQPALGRQEGPGADRHVHPAAPGRDHRRRRRRAPRRFSVRAAAGVAQRARQVHVPRQRLGEPGGDRQPGREGSLCGKGAES